MRTGPDIHIELPLEACPIRAQQSLRESHAAAVETALGLLEGTWSVERHHDYNGSLFLLLIPDGGDAAGASFVLHRDVEGVQLVATRGDAYDTLGTVQTLQAAIQRIRQHVSWRGTHCAA